MSISQYWENLLLADMQVETPRMQEKWRQAVLGGNVLSVARMVRMPARNDEKKRISPSMSPTNSGMNPLIALAKTDFIPAVCHDQAVVAKILIAQGCELTVPDKFMMLPADYALLSGDQSVCEAIVIPTIQKLKESGRADYIPNVDGFFATCADPVKRFQAFNNLTVNHRRIGREILSPQYAVYASLSDEEINYWQRPYQRLLFDMPYPTAEIMRAQKGTAKLESAFADVGRKKAEMLVMQNQKEIEWIESREYRLELAHMKLIRQRRKLDEWGHDNTPAAAPLR